jgi:type IV pilus modification protein PilV
MAIRVQLPNLRSGEQGMTIVEVLVAMVILVIGVLGVLSMLDTANSVTNENLARDGASALAREQLERAREMAYSDLADPTRVAATLVPALADSDAPVAATFTTRRRSIAYTTTITTCVLDDPSDGIGLAPGTPCRPQTLPPGHPSSVDSGPGSTVLALNVLGIPVTGGGQVVQALCSLVGTGLDALIGQGGALQGLISSGADVGLCSTTGGQVAVDRQAADVTAVSTAISWARPRAGHVSQRTLISGPKVQVAR